MANIWVLDLYNLKNQFFIILSTYALKAQGFLSCDHVQVKGASVAQTRPLERTTALLVFKTFKQLIVMDYNTFLGKTLKISTG